MVDVIIIGSGIVGASVARELSRYKAEIVVLEKGNDVSVGTTKANSGIVHAGFDAKHGSAKAKFNVLGNAMFDKLSSDLDFPFKRNGSMVLCFDKADEKNLYALLEKGKENGVKELEIISGDEARALEPNISTAVVSALVAKTGGIVSPYEMNIAFAENAAVNGVTFEFEKEVVDIKKTDCGFTVFTKDGSEYSSKIVVNAAGVYSDEMNNLVCEEKLSITARKGDYELLDKVNGNLCSHTLFQLPTAMGKGILVSPTTHGNILIGPTAIDTTDKNDVSTTMDALNDAFDKARLTMPCLNKRMIITAFSGLRAHESHDDFTVGESSVSGFFNAAGIESPGLTSAPAIGDYLAQEISKKMNFEKKDNFVEKRKGIPHFANLSNDERRALIATNHLYGNIVCRCENVTGGEIVDSIKRPLGAKDIDGVKRRTRAGMGRCQAGFCTPRVMEILARELGISMLEVTKRGGKSEIVARRTK